MKNTSSIHLPLVSHLFSFYQMATVKFIGGIFFNNGWKDKTDSPARDGTTRTNFFPKERNESLDRNILQRLGL
eukprot:15365582-Ditylum_brightwellii.AAC.1